MFPSAKFFLATSLNLQSSLFPLFFINYLTVFSLFPFRPFLLYWHQCCWVLFWIRIKSRDMKSFITKKNFHVFFFFSLKQWLNDLIVLHGAGACPKNIPAPRRNTNFFPLPSLLKFPPLPLPPCSVGTKNCLEPTHFIVKKKWVIYINIGFQRIFKTTFGIYL